MKKIFYYLIIVSLFFCFKDANAIKDPIPKHDSLIIISKFLNENRVINVWVPPIYDETNDSLPVLYMPDGGTKEDFPHIANTLAKLIKNNKIPPIILVGIENTDRRRDLTGFSEVKDDEQYCPLTDGATNFRNFIVRELMPEINQKYRTKNHKGIIGESLAGLFVMETFLIHPETFDFYIAMDPSLWWNDHFLVKNANSLLEKFPSNTIKLWFASSSAVDISQYSNDLDKILQNYTSELLDWKYSHEPKEKHNTIFRATKEKALIWTLNKNE